MGFLVFLVQKLRQKNKISNFILTFEPETLDSPSNA